MHAGLQQCPKHYNRLYVDFCSRCADEREDPFGEVISSYSRAQAIDDGFLIDVTEAARETGFRFPVALTHAAYEDAVAWAPADNERKGTLQDEHGRLHDVLWMAFLAIRRAPAGKHDRLTFSLVRTPREGTARAPKPVQLEFVIGPGDTPDPVITIQFPGED